MTKGIIGSAGLSLRHDLRSRPGAGGGMAVPLTACLLYHVEPASRCTVSTDPPSIGGSSSKSFPALSLRLAALLLRAVSFASAADLEWNQERVAALAQDLIEPLEALGADLESRPAVPEKEAARAAVRSDIERLLRANELAQRL